MKKNQIRELVNELRDIAVEYHGTQQLRERIARTVRAAWHHDLEKPNQPVSQTYNLPELIEGMEVSIDVSTCGADAGNRYFGTVTEVSELYTAKNGYILLVQDAKPNFDVNGNSPVTPDGWISCSERMPPTNVAVLVCVNGVVQKSVFCWDGESWGDWYDEYDELAQTTFTHWMPLPEPPQEVNRG